MSATTQPHPMQMSCDDDDINPSIVFDVLLRDAQQQSVLNSRSSICDDPSSLGSADLAVGSRVVTSTAMDALRKNLAVSPPTKPADVTIASKATSKLQEDDPKAGLLEPPASDHLLSPPSEPLMVNAVLPQPGYQLMQMPGGQYVFVQQPAQQQQYVAVQTVSGVQLLPLPAGVLPQATSSVTPTPATAAASVAPPPPPPSGGGAAAAPPPPYTAFVASSGGQQHQSSRAPPPPAYNKAYSGHAPSRPPAVGLVGIDGESESRTSADVNASASLTSASTIRSSGGRPMPPMAVGLDDAPPAPHTVPSSAPRSAPVEHPPAAPSQVPQQYTPAVASAGHPQNPFFVVPKRCVIPPDAPGPGKGKTRFLCPLCDQSGFVSEFVLRSHLRAKHSSDAPLLVRAPFAKKIGALILEYVEQFAAGRSVALADAAQSLPVDVVEEIIDNTHLEALLALQNELMVFQYSEEELLQYGITDPAIRKNQLRVALVGSDWRRGDASLPDELPSSSNDVLTPAADVNGDDNAHTITDAQPFSDFANNDTSLAA